MKAFEINTPKTPFCSFFSLQKQLTVSQGRLLASCLPGLHLHHPVFHPSSPGAEEESQAEVVKASDAGHDGQPVEEAQVSADYQKHLHRKERSRGC